jgi:uncharacterized repeat protein (TIGR01451 family)
VDVEDALRGNGDGDTLMEKKLDLVKQIIKCIPRTYRLINIALVLSLLLQFMPTAAEITLHVPAPRWPRFTAETIDTPPFAFEQAAFRSVDLSFPVGTTSIRADGGLDITKTASANVVNQGGLLVYTLLITNNTGLNLENIVVTDTVPLNTTCLDIFSSAQWFSSLSLCQNGEAKWRMPTLFGDFLPDGSTARLTYTVRVDQPLPNQFQIVNEAGSYGVTAEEQGNPVNTFFDPGPQSITTTVNAPNWLLQKTVVPTPTVSLGGVLTYTITLTNNGALTTSGPYTITEVLPDNTQLSANPDGGVANNGVITWTLTNPLVPGEGTQVSFSAVVTNAIPNGWPIVNATYLVTGGNVFSPAIGTPITVTALTFDLSKSVIPAGTLKAGQSLTYTIYYTNSSSFPASNIRITDTMPVSVTGPLTIDAPGATVVDDVLPTLVFTRDSLVSGSGVITIVGQVLTSPWPTQALSFTNYVSATVGGSSLLFADQVTSFAGPADPFEASYFADPPVTVINNPITITAIITDPYGNPILDGTPIVFSTSPALGSIPPTTSQNGQAISVLNSTTPGTTTVSMGVGPGVVVTYTAALLEISKTVDQALASPGDTLIYTVTVTNTGDTTATNVVVTDMLPLDVTMVGTDPPIAAGAFPTYTFNLPDIPPFGIAETLQITVTVNLNAPDATLFVNQAGVTARETTVSPTASATTTLQASAFAIFKTGLPANATAGDTITYTVSFTSNGTIPVIGLRITDTLPLSLTGVNIISNVNGLTEEAAPFPNRVFSLSTPFSGTGVITIGGQLVTAPWPSTQLPVTNRVTATIDVNPTIFSDVATIIGSSGPPFTMTLVATPVITQVGNTIVITATMIDQYGNPIVDGQTVSFSSDLAGSSFTSPNPTLSNNGLANALLTSTNGGQALVTAQVGGISRTTVVTFTAPSLAITKTSDRDLVAPGGTVVYTIVVSNTGDTPLTNVSVTDFLVSTELLFVSASPAPASVAGQTVYFSPFTLDPGLTRTLILTATVDPGAISGLILDNTAVVTATEIPGMVQGTKTVETVFAALNIAKNVSPAVVLAGEMMTYTITYTNNNALPATNIRITDTLPAAIAANPTIDPGGAVVVDGTPRTLVFNRDVLAPFTTDVITIVGQVITSPWPASGLNLTNLVTATSDLDAMGQTAQVTNQGRPNLATALTITANPISTIVGNNVAVSVAVTDQYGNPVYDGTPVDFAWSLSGPPPASATTTNGVATTNLSSSVAGTVVVTATSGSAVDNVTITFTEPAARQVYLPLIQKSTAPSALPVDLVVDLIEVSPPNPNTGEPVVISVTIRNTGTALAGRFWVDLYITTQPVSPGVNQLWSDFGPLGVAWLVPGLDGGQSLTLSNLNPNDYSNPTACENYSRFTPAQVGACSWPANSHSFSSGGTYYVTAQVDAFDEDLALGDGNIVEVDETNNVYANPLTISVTPLGRGDSAAPERPVYEPIIPGAPRSPLRQVVD